MLLEIIETLNVSCNYAKLKKFKDKLKKFKDKLKKFKKKVIAKFLKVATIKNILKFAIPLEVFMKILVRCQEQTVGWKTPDRRIINACQVFFT